MTTHDALSLFSSAYAATLSFLILARAYKPERLFPTYLFLPVLLQFLFTLVGFFQPPPTSLSQCLLPLAGAPPRLVLEELLLVALLLLIAILLHRTDSSVDAQGHGLPIFACVLLFVFICSMAFTRSAERAVIDQHWERAKRPCVLVPLDTQRHSHKLNGLVLESLSTDAEDAPPCPRSLDANLGLLLLTAATLTLVLLLADSLRRLVQQWSAFTRGVPRVRRILLVGVVNLGLACASLLGNVVYCSSRFGAEGLEPWYTVAFTPSTAASSMLSCILCVVSAMHSLQQSQYVSVATDVELA